MLPPAIVAYLALFATVGFLFVFASLLLGKFLRAYSPTSQKVESYECGEPAVGSGAVQFDLRFYVVALLFLIFEVEVAFFFPPATVFGRSVQMLGREKAVATDVKVVEKQAAKMADTESGRGVKGDSPIFAETKIGTVPRKTVLTPFSAPALALASMIDLAVFFAALLVGFAFVWRRGDLDWVRAIRHPATPQETAALMAKLRRDDVSP
jgi:NADH-quinone oxidoreductase subunit A